MTTMTTASASTLRLTRGRPREFYRCRFTGPKGCTPNAAPHCCVEQHCQCDDGHVYAFNDDNLKAGGSGCDVPGRFLAQSTARLPTFCCLPQVLCIGPEGLMSPEWCAATGRVEHIPPP
ncbi:Thioesterase/thiol ester dehydrase-isomerase [Ophiocordyceps camponoti-floridani]|uniref:Thioesterase/thiol ester dehydrase-isomerase n=1 Tax=Ophiocordyceps camponoti-floridani TaxID=2030778 RepID=A0A8H4QAQ5_9HYPO|nr:Thioesterase/thiol ester dehydrase-isomerase [Ophiocordyceps camponoti-floridani]